MYEHLSHQLQRFGPDDPYEQCGFLFSRRYGTPISFREVPNSHPESWHKFRIAMPLYHQAMASFTLKPAERGVVGILHTHPGRDRDDWYPSASDHAGAAQWPELMHLVYHPFTRRLTWFHGGGIRESFHLKARWMTRRMS